VVSYSTQTPICVCTISDSGHRRVADLQRAHPSRGLQMKDADGCGGAGYGRRWVVGVGRGMTVRRWRSLTFGSRVPQGVVGRRGWRPRTTVGFAGPGKSIAGAVTSPHQRGRRWWTEHVARLLFTRTGSCGGVGVGGGGRVEWGPPTRAVGVPRK